MVERVEHWQEESAIRVWKIVVPMLYPYTKNIGKFFVLYLAHCIKKIKTQKGYSYTSPYLGSFLILFAKRTKIIYKKQGKIRHLWNQS